MNSSQKSKTILSVSIILVGFIAVFFLSNFVENTRPPMPIGYEDEDLVFQGSKLKGFTLGLDGLVADWYWMQSLQYLGGKFAKNPDININVSDLSEFDPKLLYPLLDNAVSFDPQFMGVYEYGAVVLPAVDPKLAIKFIEGGIENNPNEWRLYNHLGYIYWKSGNYEKASEAYTKASQIEGASPIMKMMAARMKNDGGSRETARVMYQQIYEAAQDEKSKENTELYLKGLDSLDEIDAINGVLATFGEDKKKCPGNLRDIIPLLEEIKLPNGRDFQVDKEQNLVDTSGVPYIYNQEKCEVELNKEKTKLPF